MSEKKDVRNVVSAATTQGFRGTAELISESDTDYCLQWIDVFRTGDMNCYSSEVYTKPENYPKEQVNVLDFYQMGGLYVDLTRSESIDRDEKQGVFDRYAQLFPSFDSEDLSDVSKEDLPFPEVLDDKPKEPKPAVVFLRVSNAMIHSMKGYPDRKAVTLGLCDESEQKVIGTLYQQSDWIHPDKRTQYLPESQQKSFVSLNRNDMYDFVTREKQPDGTTKTQVQKLTGGELCARNRLYLDQMRESKLKSVDKERTVEEECTFSP